MGVKYALPEIPEQSPTHVEGHHHWKTYGQPTIPDSVGLLVSYWQDSVHISERRIIVTRHYMLDKWGGTQADWDSILATAGNSSDTDDVVQEIVESEWGCCCMWQHFRLMQGGA